MEELKDILDVITNYGALTIMAGLFIYVFFFLNKIIVRTLNNILNGKISSINKDRKQVHETGLNLRMELTSQVETYLRAISSELKADRVFITELHNSHENISGVPFAKFSCTYEYCKIGNIPCITKLRNYSIAMIGEIIGKVLNSERGMCKIQNLESIKTHNYVLYSILNDYNINAIYSFGLFDINNRLYAMVHLCFNNKKILTEPSIKKIETYIYKLSSLLDITHSQLFIQNIHKSNDLYK